MVIEKLLPLDYFSPGLLGAQADQVLCHRVIVAVTAINVHRLF